jgi:hypothetical protein
VMTLEFDSFLMLDHILNPLFELSVAGAFVVSSSAHYEFFSRQIQYFLRI